MSNLPTGTITFLFTDIEGSTQLWEHYPELACAALARHDALIEDIVVNFHGVVVRPRGEGDSRFAVFPLATDAVGAAASIQQAIFAEPWSTSSPLRIRMALHTGEADLRDGDYYGSAVNRCARLRSAGYGGQTLLSEVTSGLVRDTLPPGVQVLDIGEHRLKDLIRPEHIFQLIVPGLPSEFPPLKTLDIRPNNLPLQPTPLIGREKELAEIEKLLGREDVRVVTLTGSGGTGKTRLGLQVACELLDDFSEGVWFVDLSPLTDSRLVMLTIASVLGVKEAGSGTPIMNTLKQYLNDKKLLLLLDNFEQVADAAPQVSQLLASCPGLKVLGTSRMYLSIRGEKEYPVPPLTMPDVHDLRHLSSLEQLTQYEAVRLFIERATDVKPDFQVTNENAPAVAQICVHLDGLPLAIELAAARIRMLSPEPLLSRLSQRLRVLTGGARDLPARQQTLRNTIAWSYDLLDEGEKQLFRRMAPFSGGRSLEALEAVCNYDGQLQIDVFEGVGSLLSKSLLREVGGNSGEPRFWMLETIHEYAREQLEESGEKEALERQHALYFTALAEQADLTGAKQIEWMQRLEDEHDNLRAALRWARERGEGETEIGLRLAGPIWRFWEVRGHFSEGREQLEGALSLSAGQSSAEALPRARALNGAGMLTYRQGDYAAARSLLEQSLALQRELGDKRGIAWSLNTLGLVSYEQGDYAAARSLLEQSLAIRRELGDQLAIGASLNNLGMVALGRGEYASAQSLFEETLATWRGVENTHGTAMALNNLGLVASMEGDYAGARSLVEESLAIRRELGDKVGIASSLNNLGRVEFAQGNYVNAHSLFWESLAIRQELGDKRGSVLTLAGLGALAVAVAVAVAVGAVEEEEGKGGIGGVEQAQRGATMLGAVEGLLVAIGTTMEPHDRIPYEQTIVTARSLLGEEAFAKARAEGRAMNMEQAIKYALEEIQN